MPLEPSQETLYSTKVLCFVSGLRESVRADVQTASPISLTEAVSFARLYEAKFLSMRRTSIGEHHRSSSLSTTTHISPPQNSTTTPTIKRLTPAEMQIRRDKGLCFNCDKKFVPGHRCKRLFLIDLVEDETSSEEDDEADAAADPGGPVPEISPHAMTGTPSPQTMRVPAMLGNRHIVILIDSGSTHNFLSLDVAAQQKIFPNRQEKLGVLVASDEKLDC